VYVRYANRGSDADSRIENLVEHSPMPEMLTVVTSDQRLTDQVRRLGAQVMRRELDSLNERSANDAPSTDQPRRVTRRDRRL
jgi:predicted RNA-binding protein with PIN domain